jgi:hypothetical protein
MAKKKTRKAPAMAPVIRQRVAPVGAVEPDAGALRPDPDQPPMDGTTGRPSVYSEWLNTTSRTPAASAWLNEPVDANPRLRGAMRDVGLEPKPAAPQGEGQAGPRKRLSTRARKLGQGERLQVEPDATRPGAGPAADPRRQLAPTVPARPTMGAAPGANLPRSTRVMQAMPGDSRAQGMGTNGRQPAMRRDGGGPAPRGTAGRIPALADQPTARVPAAHDTASHAALARQTGAPAAARSTPSGSLVIHGTRVPKATGPVVPRRLRPPSFVMQGVVALATVVVLLGVLTVSSPLGYGAALSGTFQAYANSVKWVPTPTPTATPVPLNTTFGGVPPSPGQQVIVDEIKQVFGSYAQGALNVSHCESGWDPSARNPYPVGNSHAEGVFQILYPSTWNTTSYASRNPYDYDANIRAAYEIFHRDGNSWAEWECQP